MKKEFSLEEKMSAIGFVFQGESAHSVSRRLHLGHHILYEWIERYKLLGIEGLKLKSKKKKRLSYEEKCKIVREYQESELTLFQLSAKYQLSSSIIGNWVKLVERNGFEALAIGLNWLSEMDLKHWNLDDPGISKQVSIWLNDYPKKSTKKRMSVFARRTNA